MRTSAQAFVFLIVLAFFAGCNLNTDYFGDYRGKNILGNADFGSGKWALESYPTYVTLFGGSYSPSDYMNWAPPATGVGSFDTGPDGSSASYRLEIKNLFQDGDFELQTAPSAVFGAPDSGFWTLSGSANVSFANSGNVPSLSPLPAFINNKSLYFYGSSSSNYLSINLATAVGALFQRQGGYRFRFSFYNATSGNILHASLNNQGGSTILNAENNGLWDATPLVSYNYLPLTQYSVSRTFTLDGTATVATAIIGATSGPSQDGAVIDDVRVIQNDIPPYVVLKFSSLSSGTAQLLPGSKSGAYLLTFYVRDDPTADETGLSGTAHTLNRLYASGVTVSIKAAVKSGNGTFIRFFPRPSGGWTGWTKISVPLGFDFVDQDSQIPSGQSALAIELSPTNTMDLTTGGRDAGSVLVTQPVLAFNP